MTLFRGSRDMVISSKKLQWQLSLLNQRDRHIETTKANGQLSLKPGAGFRAQDVWKQSSYTEKLKQIKGILNWDILIHYFPTH